MYGEILTALISWKWIKLLNKEKTKMRITPSQLIVKEDKNKNKKNFIFKIW